jgi:hypothetical protein
MEETVEEMMEETMEELMEESAQPGRLPRNRPSSAGACPGVQIVLSAPLGPQPRKEAPSRAWSTTTNFKHRECLVHNSKKTHGAADSLIELCTKHSSP